MILKIFNSIRNRGVKSTVDLIQKRLVSKYELYQNLKFDAKNGTETSKHEMEYVRKAKSKNWKYAYNYEPVSTKDFYESIAKIPFDFSQYIFLDLGSGKGKALMLAAEYPFKKIIGVEFSTQLHERAKNNIDIFKRKHNNNFQLILEDATMYDFPHENIILFLYNPFQGKVLEQIVKKIENHIIQTSKNIYIIYHHPINSEIYDKNEFLELLYGTKKYKIYRNKQ